MKSRNMKALVIGAFVSFSVMILVRVFSDVLVAFLYFDICH